MASNQDSGDEEWRSINLDYDASSLGRIRSAIRWPKTRILKPAKNKNGYLMVMLGRGNSRYVHELVLLAFRGTRPGLATASHLNGKRTDNRIENLVWESQRDNCARKVAHGTNNNGERQGHARLTEAQVREIRAALPKHYGFFSALARKYGVSAQAVEDAYKKRTWRHI